MTIDTPPSVCAEPRTMKLLYFSNEFPHDDLHELLRRLHNHSKDRRHPVLARFIEEASLALRHEVAQLPAATRALIPPFETILNLADFSDLRKGPLCGAVDGVLLIVVQLAAFIGYFENHPHELDFDPVKISLSGLGTGLLTSAAVALAPTLADIPLSGAEVVRVAFRLGIHVDEVSHNLEPREPTGPPDTWACVISDVLPADVQRALDVVHAKEGIPDSAKVFISALSQTSVTISGPPARLKALFRNHDYFRDSKSVNLPVYGGLCHAQHIYGQGDVHKVARTASKGTDHAHFAPAIPVFSCGSGRPYEAGSATELLEHVTSELLTRPIQWENVVKGLVERSKELSVSECQVLVFRMSLPVRELMLALKEVPQLDTSTLDLMSWIATPSAEELGPRGPMQSKIAIVGMSCRLPGGATDVEKFWELLDKGMDVHRKIPADRFDVETHHDPTGKRMNTSHTAYGCFIDEPGLFDAPFFNVSPREAAQTDPMQRLALVTAYEALEQAGFVPNRTASTTLSRVGTFYGQAADDYREVNAGQEVGTYYIPGGCRAFGPGRINYFFKFSGPSFSVDTACSSSLAAIQVACTSLWAGDCDTVVAGGMNVLTNSDGFAGLCNGHFLTKTPNACKTWDSEADGYCRADGIGSVVLKRLEDAEADNDNILGVILGAATNHSAEAVSITHPHAGAQSDLGRKVIDRAGVDPLDVSYVEMHGTGTQAGDLVEIKSVTDVFAPAAATRRRGAKQPLHIGAVKSNLGHSEAAAGITALLKVLLMFDKCEIPRHVGVKNGLNPGFPKDLDKRNVRVPFEKQPWPRVPGKKRIAVVNNFSAAGGNTTLAIEEGHVKDLTGTDPRPSHVVAVSAKSKASLKGNLERHLAYLDSHPEVSLADLSYSTTARKYQHNYRVVVAASEISQVKKQLASGLAAVDSHKAIPATGSPSVVFAFTGQGASYQSMNLELFHQAPYFRAQIQHLDSLARRQGFPSFIPALDGSFPKEHTHGPVITQLALVSTEIALAKYWGSLGVRPSVVIGHSLGEYAALYVAGVLSASDAIFLVGHRARLLEEKCRIGSHKMMAVRASLAEIEQAAGGKPYEVACINAPKEIVLSGPREEIDALGETLQAADHRCISLDVAFAFHSAQTDPILDEFETRAKTAVVFKALHLPVVSPLLGKVIFDEKTVNANYVRRATRETVNFAGALETAVKFGTVDEKTAWIEIGPHPVCMGFVKANSPSTAVAVPSMRRGENNWTTMAQSLCALHSAGVDLDWNEFHRPFEPALRLLNLPTYSWNDKNYWLQYNGDWALTKGNTFYDEEKKLVGKTQSASLPISTLKTTAVQHIIEESVSGSAAKVAMQSDLMQKDLLAAANGHSMNGCGVVTSSIHADIAFTLGEYLYKKFYPSAKNVDMNVANLEVLKGLVAQKNHKVPQIIQVSIETTDIQSGLATLYWHTVTSNGTLEDPFASATLQFGHATDWLATWSPTTHLVQGRIEALERLARDGLANRLSHNMTYGLFAANLVDYAPAYRGMQSVVLHGLEAAAEVVLARDDAHGSWTVPPWFIDSVAHLAGFVMNVSDAVDTRANFCVTPGWRSMRFARPLVAGGRYVSYVKMIPTVADPTVYFGDVYILQDGEIVGMVGGIQFRRYPRVLLNRFFSAPDDTGKPPASSAPARRPSVLASVPPVVEKPVVSAVLPAPAPLKSTPVAATAPVVSERPPASSATTAVATEDAGAEGDSTVTQALALIAREAALELSDLDDEASFGSLGVDSLMSLVIAEKFREELGVTVSGGLFLEYPTIGDLRAWLEEYYG